MKFTSLGFLIFFLVVYTLHWSIRGKTARLIFLFLASVGFYAAWSIPFAIHFLVVVAVSHFLNRIVLKNPDSKAFYAVLFLNLSNLFFFKYFYFLWDLLLTLSGSAFFERETIRNVLDSSFGVDSITLPLAISFYSFQMIAYSIDIKRRTATEDPNFLQFALFIFFFPQLVAGPIVRHSEFFFQLETWSAKREQLFEGFYLVFLGLLKKVVIADNLGAIIDPVFHSPSSYDGVSNIFAMFGYMGRVFCDFSGYTDIARGLGKLLGIDLPENFKAPYLSRSIGELWTRWHITLGAWIKDYIYIPLGGSKVSEFRGNLNLLITFTLAGFWHGASFAFILWGFGQAMFLCIERKVLLSFPALFTKENPSYLKKFLGFVYMFIVFTLFTSLFNGKDVPSAFAMLGQSFSLGDGLRMGKLESVVYAVILTFLLNYLQLFENFPRKHWSLLKSVSFLIGFSFLVLVLLGYLAPGGAEFIYFQF
ncbi:MAG: MBOAT family protein [Leptospira sp.]|nr:MBOAT family protein [Leptospira sp.]